ncbi:MAG: thioredoxin domain-containing protein [Patescibacteria group bacterium]|jgi:glutaredoxin
MNFRNIFKKVKPAVGGKKLATIISIVLILLILVAVGIVVYLKNSNVKKVLKPEEAMVVAEKFINENLVSPSNKATIKSAVLEGDVYNIVLTVGGKDYTSYMTKDGAKFFESGIDMAKFAEENKAQQTASTDSAQPTNVPKSDKPKVELFVMTECPYGLQAEKGILPAFAALGNKIDASIRFVHYFMHGDKEEQETYNQICIRDEQAAKYDSYLNCYVIQGDNAKCVAQAGIDKAKMDSCVASKAKDIYKADSALSNQYGVEGSPTLIINGAQSSAGRDAASYLAGICAAFNTAPAECSKQLSSATPSASFGAGEDSSDSEASCN